MEKIILNGKNLTIDLIHKIANDKTCLVEIDVDVRKSLVEARQLVFDLVDEGVQIYGFNTGVGWNKDQHVFEDFFQEYNTKLVLSHCVCAGEVLSDVETRAVMLARLGGFLSGCTGSSLDVIEGYLNFINKGISPLMPRSGSVGVADITNLPHIGLAMLGEGEVYYEGDVIPAKLAIEKSGLEVINLGPKDGLAIVSSNAFSAGLASLMLKEAKDLMEMSSLILATSFDGYIINASEANYNNSNIKEDNIYTDYAKKVHKHLSGSSVFKSNQKLSTQDPLSFKNALHVNASAIDSLNNLEELLTIQINSSDDNPCLLLEERRIISCCNFETINWVLAVEEFGQYLSHVSKLACYRNIKFCDNEFTNLPYFLSSQEGSTKFKKLQKVYCDLDSEIRFLSNPASLDYLALAGDIEDRGNNTPYVVTKTAQIVDNLYYILGIELLHACKAIDLRKDYKLGNNVEKVYKLYKGNVTLDDNNITEDIQNSYEFLKSKIML